jgi:CRISPR-associated protein Cmr5
MKTMEQEFAEKVYQTIKAREGKPDVRQYGSVAHKLPILIRTAGLAEGLAFAESRGKAPINDLMDDLAQVVSGQSRGDLVSQSRTADMQDYIHLTRSTMLALKWFKRFAQSVLGVDPAEEGDTL